MVPPGAAAGQRRHHDSHLMIFMNRTAGQPPVGGRVATGSLPWVRAHPSTPRRRALAHRMTLRLKINLIVGALTILFVAAVLALQLRSMRESVHEEVVAA